MYLCDGKIGNEYKVEDIDLPVNIEKRLEALGMTRGTSIAVLNSKSRSEFIERAIKFYDGYNRSTLENQYLPVAISSAVQGTVKSSCKT